MFVLNPAFNDFLRVFTPSAVMFGVSFKLCLRTFSSAVLEAAVLEEDGTAEVKLTTP